MCLARNKLAGDCVNAVNEATWPAVSRELLAAGGFDHVKLASVELCGLAPPGDRPNLSAPAETIAAIREFLSEKVTA